MITARRAISGPDGRKLAASQAVTLSECRASLPVKASNQRDKHWRFGGKNGHWDHRIHGNAAVGLV
jgi:hypothetical protein